MNLHEVFVPRLAPNLYLMLGAVDLVGEMVHDSWDNLGFDLDQWGIGVWRDKLSNYFVNLLILLA